MKGPFESLIVRYPFRDFVPIRHIRAIKGLLAILKQTTINHRYKN
jgi:hypothetical protein